MAGIAPVSFGASGGPAAIAAVTARIGAIESTFSSPMFAKSFSAAQSALNVSASTTAGPSAEVLPTGASTASILGMATAGAPPAASSATADRVVARAREFIGVPYVWGAEQENAVDCSGLMVQVFEHFGIDVPRVSRDQSQAGVAVSKENLRPGDMVFFDYSSSRAGVDHVGLYVGDGKMIHAPRPGATVTEAPVDWSAFTNARRVIPEASPSAAVTPLAAADGTPAARATGGLSVNMLPSAGREWAGTITAAATKNDLDPNLLAALVWSESAFNKNAKSSAGAVGLAQLMPATAAGLGVNPHDPVQNINGAAKYLAAQIDRFGSTELGLAAYNAGPGNVTKYGGVPPFAETKGYVAAVTERYHLLGGSK